MEDLEEAVTYRHQALSLCPDGHPHRPASLDSLASTISIRFQLLGEMQDLEDVITYYYRALALCPPGHPHRPTSFDGLADALSTRFGHLGEMEDLENAIMYHRQALALFKSSWACENQDEPCVHYPRAVSSFREIR
jgi:tetratricopeptide (TPR) repeat protein